MFVLTSSKQDGFPPLATAVKGIQGAMNVNGNELPTFTFTILAVGINEGAQEDLNRITLSPNRVITSQSWGGLSKNSGVYKSITNMASNPPAYGQSTAPTAFQSNLFGGLNTLKDTSNEGGQLVLTALAEEEKCHQAVDIAFLVDSSHSIRLDWQKELFFVQQIAHRFNISEAGAHAGVVVFSDLSHTTRVEIKMKDYLNWKDFNEAVKNLPYIGYRTRMDLAFNRTHQELFTKEGGVREAIIPRLVILITDGKQNPTKSNDKTEAYDPVQTSKPLYEHPNTVVIAIGVTKDVDREQLNQITRDPSKVSVVDSIEELISKEFVKQISKKLCEAPAKIPTKPPAVTTTCAPPKVNFTCQGVGKCSSCCGSNDVYINIFQSSGNYVMQGMKLTQTDGKMSGSNIPSTTTNINLSSTEDVINAITTLLPQQKDLAERLRKILDKHPSGAGGLASPLRASPGVADLKRKRRSVEFSNTGSEFTIYDLAKTAGCGLFVKSLHKHNLLHFLRQPKHLNDGPTLFCPTDDAFRKFLRQPRAGLNEKDVLLYHLVSEIITPTTVRSQHHGAVLHLGISALSGNRITALEVEEANILYHIRNERMVLSVIDEVLIPPTASLLQVLKTMDMKQTSMFRSLLDMSGFNAIDFEQVDKICFESGACVGMHKNLQQKFTQSSPLTVLAPTNREMLSMKKFELNNLYTDKKYRDLWLRQHVFVGQITSGNNAEHEEVMVSSDSSHSAATRVRGLETSQTKLNVFGRVYDVMKGPRKFREGSVYIVEQE